MRKEIYKINPIAEEVLHFAEKYDWPKLVGIISSIIIIVFIVSLYWMLKLKREIETRKQMEEALQRAKEEGKLANQIKAIFLARISDETRTSLNTISGMVEVSIHLLETQNNSALRIKQEPLKAPYPYHVLIVEDNKTNQFIGQSILEESGFRVSLQDNGKEGYEFFLKNQSDVDLILMDLHMPILNGYEATSLIRNKDTNIPIIAITAEAIGGVEGKCKNVGINHYISKPFEPKQFIEMILYALQPYEEKIKYPIKKAKIVLSVEEGIKNLGGKEDIYNMILREYYEENKEILLVLSRAIEKKDYKAAIQIVHKIKSSTGSIGAKRLYGIASQFQKALQNEITGDVIVLHKEFEEILTLLLLEIKQRIL